MSDLSRNGTKNDLGESVAGSGPGVSRRTFLAGTAAASVMMPSSFAFAQAEYPSRPITMILGFSPGGGNDILGRYLALKMTERLGQPVVVENRTGSSGNVGLSVVASSRPDGYTISLGTNGTQALNQLVHKDMPYNSATAFTNICDIARIANALVVTPSLGIGTVAELVEYVRKNSGKVFFGSAGIGSIGHLAMELMNSMIGARMMHVTYRGSSQVLLDLMGGRIHATLDNIPSSKPLMAAGKIRGLAVSSPKRWFALPELPAISETLPGFSAMSWQYIVGPAGIPRPIVEKLNKTLNDILLEDAVKAKAGEMGIQLVGGSPADLDNFVKGETDRWRKILTDAGVQPQ